MERTVFRPLREQSPTVMLVTTFAISFVLQSVALLIDIRDDQIGEPAASLASLNQAITIAGVDVRKVTIVAVARRDRARSALLALLLGRTEIGLRTRAAAARLPHRAHARRQGQPGDRARRSCSRARWPRPSP